MTEVIKSRDYEELWQEATQTGNTHHSTDETETIHSVKHRLGEKHHRIIHLHPGFDVWLIEQEHSQPVVYDCQHPEFLPLLISFRLTGAIQERTDGVTTGPLIQSAGENSLICVAGKKELEHYPPGQSHVLCVCFSPDFLTSLSRGQPDALPNELKPLLEGNPLPVINRSLGKYTPAVQVALQQLLNCPYAGMLKRTYIESKALELMTLQFAEILQAERARVLAKRLRASDIDRIHQAKAILLRKISNPPSISELARQVGLNQSILKQGFQQVFGTTPFGYLREQRLELARQLLMNTEVSVEAVATLIGYANRGHFAAAFNKKFGLKPKSYQIQFHQTDV